MPSPYTSIMPFPQRPLLTTCGPALPRSLSFSHHASPLQTATLHDPPPAYNHTTSVPPSDRQKDTYRVRSLSISRHPSHVGHRQNNFGLLWTTIIVVVPIMGFTATVVACVFAYRLASSQRGSLVQLPTSKYDNRFLLVNFSATRLGLIASFSSTAAPLLLGSLMWLWHIPTAHCVGMHSFQESVEELPTPRQLGLLLGLLAGSFDGLRKYILYKATKRRASEPRILTKSAHMMVLSIFLSGMIFFADTAVHTFTSTVVFSQYTGHKTPEFAFGRGIVSECVNFNRTANAGLPCTVLSDSSVGTNILARNTGEIIALEWNTSTKNSMWTVEDPALSHGDLILFMPQTTSIPADLDFTATTVGVSTQCRPMTKSCNTRLSDGATLDDMYAIFNCTDNFRGVLGAPPSVSNETMEWTHTDSATPNFNVKSDRNFQYAYFSNPQLTNIYNSIGGDATNGDSSSQLALSDSELINPVHIATAGLIPLQNGPAGTSLGKDPEMLLIGGSFVAYTLNCTVTSYDVQYIWTSGRIHNITYTPTKDGSILELAHGIQAVGVPSLSSAQSLAMLSNSSNALARSFANSHSIDSLTLIGSVLAPRANLGEATRKNLLVTKLSTIAFILLVGSNTLFIILACVLATRAWMVRNSQTMNLMARLSVEGVVAAAFEDSDQKRRSFVSEVHELFEEREIRNGSRRVGLVRSHSGGHKFTTLAGQL